MRFDLLKTDGTSQARAANIETEHGVIETPVFMPVGTRGTVKTLTIEQTTELGPKIILGNTYHLMLRPGMKIMEMAGGLHQFMGWDKALLTDSGGYQVFSLSALNKITEEGVHFQSHIDGSRHFLGPQESMQIQRTLGADIVMIFDECSPYPCEKGEAERALARTLRWARSCRDFNLKSHQNLFGIVQGSTYPDLRKHSALALQEMNFEGYAIGGLSVGEPALIMNDVIDATVPFLPQDKPRYLMGVGTPRNIIEAVRRGIDMFDCVMPTRNARNGTAFTWSGKINIKAGKYSEDFSPLDPLLDHPASRYSKSYVRHLLNVGEMTGLSIVTMQNLAFYLDFMKQLRQSIINETFSDFYQRICALYPE